MNFVYNECVSFILWISYRIIQVFLPQRPQKMKTVCNIIKYNNNFMYWAHYSIVWFDIFIFFLFFCEELSFFKLIPNTIVCQYRSMSVEINMFIVSSRVKERNIMWDTQLKKIINKIIFYESSFRCRCNFRSAI